MSFSSRIETIMSHYNLSPKELADKLGVQRSSISHIVNGRNKPSVAFITKLSEAFPDLDTRWVLHGKPPMITSVNTHEEELTDSGHEQDFGDVIQEVMEDTPVTESPKNEIDNSTKGDGHKRIIRIVSFYSDGTFDVYTPAAE